MITISLVKPFKFSKIQFLINDLSVQGRTGHSDYVYTTPERNNAGKIYLRLHYPITVL